MSDLDASKVVFDFDRLSDTLYVYFHGQPRPSVSVPFDDHYLAMVDLETEETIGLHIDGFLVHVVHEVPLLWNLAEEIGLRSDEIEWVQQGSLPEKNKQEILASLLYHAEILLAARR